MAKSWVDLRQPELVKEYFAKRSCSERRKLRLVYELIRYYKEKGVAFDPPHYRQVDRLLIIPLKSEIDALISG